MSSNWEKRKEDMEDLMTELEFYYDVHGYSEDAVLLIRMIRILKKEIEELHHLCMK